MIIQLTGRYLLSISNDRISMKLINKDMNKTIYRTRFDYDLTLENEKITTYQMAMIVIIVLS